MAVLNIQLNIIKPKISNHFPRFLNFVPFIKLKFGHLLLHGGYGAPQAVDTIETLAALDVKNIITIGMFGTSFQVM